jgi:hypothetical protein
MMEDRDALLRRCLAVGLLLALLLVPAFLILSPLTASWQERGERIDSARHLLAAYRTQAAERPGLEARLKDLKQQDSAITGLLTGASDDLAEATLQADIRHMVEEVGGEIHSAQPVKSANEAGFERVEARFDLTVKQPALPGLLTRIETHQPLLFADRVQIETSDLTGKNQTLSVKLSIYGYRRPG